MTDANTSKKKNTATELVRTDDDNFSIGVECFDCHIVPCVVNI